MEFTPSTACAGSGCFVEGAGDDGTDGNAQNLLLRLAEEQMVNFNLHHPWHVHLCRLVLLW